jgi:hypothetical protein
LPRDDRDYRRKRVRHPISRVSQNSCGDKFIVYMEDPASDAFQDYSFMFIARDTM